MDDIVSITLFRHGITKENKEKRYIGWSDVPLDQEVCSQKLKQTLHFQKVFSSDLQRSIQTAEQIVPSATIKEDWRLRELHFGSWEGKSYNDLKNERSYRNWINDPIMNKPPEGESFQQFEERILHCWDEIMELFLLKEMNNILVVSHGGPIRQYLTMFSPRDIKKQWWDWKIEHFSGYTLTWDRNNIRKEGSRCISSLVVPFTVKEPGFNKHID